MREYVGQETFEAARTSVEKELFDKALDVVTKANQMLNALAQDNIDSYRKQVKDIAEIKKNYPTSSLQKEKIAEYKAKYGLAEREPRVDKLRMIEM